MAGHIRPFKQIQRALSKRDIDAALELIWSADDLQQTDKKGKKSVADLLTAHRDFTAIMTRLLVEKGVDADVNLGDAFAPMSLLRYCVLTENTELARVALEQGARVDRVFGSGYTLVHDAATKNNAELIELLRSFGADIDRASADDHDAASTPLHVAASRGNIDAARALLEQGADVNTPNHRGQTTLHIGAREKSPELVDLALAHNVDLDFRSRSGRTALHEAANKRAPSITAYLLASGASVDIADHDGWTALHVACARGEVDCVRALITGGAALDACTTQDVRLRSVEVQAGSTPLEVARAMSQRKIEEIIETEDTTVTLDELIARAFSST